MTLFSVVRDGAIHGVITLGAALAIVAVTLGVFVGITFLLRRYFRHHRFVNRAHRTGVYLLTMLGVAILLVGAFLGALLPVIPGVLFLLLALLLMRRYHRSKWVDARIRYFRFKLRIKRAIRRRLGRKGLSTRRRRQGLR